MWPLAARNGGPIRSPSAKSRQWWWQMPWPGPPGGVLTLRRVGSGASCLETSAKKGQAAEVVLGVPDRGQRVRGFRKRQRGIAERLGLTQAPLLASSLSMVPRSGGPGRRTPSALVLPPQLPAFGPRRRRDARARWFPAMTRVVRSRLMHILTGNGPSSVMYILSGRSHDHGCCCHLRGHRGGRTGRLALSRSRAMPWQCLAVGLLFLYRLAHISHGNTALIQLVDSEAIYEISGSRSGKTHRVWST